MASRQPFAEEAGACGPQGWAPPPAATVDDTEEAGARSENRKNMAMAICTMLLSVPALIGSWCWPIFLGVVVGMLSGQSFSQSADKAAAHEHTVAFFHGLQVAITMSVMLSITQYAYWTVLSRRQHVTGHWAKFGPVYLLLVAAVLVNVQPMMILIIGSWYPGKPTCNATPDVWPCHNAFWDNTATNSFFPNQASGWLIQIFCTYVGYILLVVGVVQATEMVGKMRRTWRTARG